MASNEIAERDDDRGLELLPPAQAPSAVARATLREHAAMMADAYQVAKGIVGDGRPGSGLMVPQRFRGRPEEAAAAMIYGSELGLNPLQAVQRVVPIHGMPSLEARTMVGLLKARGFKVRTVEQSDTSVTVEGEAPDGETASSTWTIQRAIQAGYVPTPSSPESLRRPDVEGDWVTVTKTWDGKAKKSIVGNMKYITDPQTMLKAKAQAEVCRELAPDVLMGISYTREELESEDQRQFDRMDERGATPARVRAPVTVDEIFAEEVPVPEPAAPHDPETVAMFVDMAKRDPRVLDDLRAMRQEREANETNQAEVTPHQAPAGDVTDNPDAERPTPADPSPAEQPQTVPAPAPDTDAEKAAKTSKRVAAKRSTAPAANPDKPKSRMRQALEKRLFALLGDAGINGDDDRDGRLAVYRAILDRPDVTSTDDLDDPAIGKVADQLYAWSQQDELDEKVAGILSDAARDADSAAPAAEPTSEGNE